jgi:type II secretory pathway predicted ATPase ExeA
MGTNEAGNDIIEALEILHDENKAIIDVLAILLMVVSRTSQPQSDLLRQILESLSDQKKRPTTKSFSSLCRFLARALKHGPDHPLMSVIPQGEEDHESLRNSLRLILGKKSLKDP